MPPLRRRNWKISINFTIFLICWIITIGVKTLTVIALPEKLLSDVNASEEHKSDTNATEPEYDDYEDYITNCTDGDTYRSVEECVSECWRVHEERNIPYVEANNTGKMKYKVVMLEENEFKIVSDGSLQSNLTTNKVPANTFSRNVNFTHVCYPLDQHFIDCKKWFLFQDEYDLYENSRMMWVEAYDRSYSVGEFYIDKATDEALVCKTTSEDSTYAIDAVFLAAYCISAMSLFFTFILSLMMPELNIRNNKILMCHMVILSFAYWLLIAKLLIPSMNTRGCLVFALLKQFSFLGAFFWVNVQAIDLFIRFLHIRGTKNSRSETLKFVIYSIYAWGSPFTICMVTLAIEKSTITYLHPNFKEHCWFDPKDKLTAFVYFFGPIAFILLTNVILFILTILKLYTVGKNASNVNKKLHNQLLQLYLKLVIVMGLCWIMEVISWAAGGDHKHWYFTDLVNALQGLFIFIIYICKPSYIRRVVYSNSFFPNRPAWWPWKGNDADQVPAPDQNENVDDDSLKYSPEDQVTINRSSNDETQI